MGWLGSIFGARRRRERRLATEGRLRATLSERGPAGAWPELVDAWREDPDHDALYRIAAHILRLGGEARTAELFDRAADAPHDPQRLLELGNALLSSDEAVAAAVALERALAFVPFDAVVRSELALAHARSGDPERVLATLALHPCLADDPGALFELAWASLLRGDLDTADGAARELRGAPALRHKLELAIARARVGGPMVDARDYYYVEHGSLLVDNAGPLDGRYEQIEVDAAWLSALLADTGAVLAQLIPAPRRVVAIDDEHWPLAEAVASACGGSVLPAGRGRLPAAILPLWEGAMIASRIDVESLRAPDMWFFAITVDHRRSLPRAPEVVGAFTRTTVGARQLPNPATVAGRRPSADVLDFVESNRTHLPPVGERVRAAYVPDAPLRR